MTGIMNTNCNIRTKSFCFKDYFIPQNSDQLDIFYEYFYHGQKITFMMSLTLETPITLTNLLLHYWAVGSADVFEDPNKRINQRGKICPASNKRVFADQRKLLEQPASDQVSFVKMAQDRAAIKIFSLSQQQ